MYQIREANQMVEEFMLAANVSVAEKILKHFPMCSLLRYTYTIDFECPTHYIYTSNYDRLWLR